MVREILLWPDPKLRESAAPVKKVDAEVRVLIADLFETMYAGNGVGLAATQVGVPLRVVVIDTSARQPGVGPMALVNPTLVKAEGEAVFEEGCLSIPGEGEEVTRAARVTVRAMDRDGKPFEVEGDQLLAVCLQHEMDHLDGVLFVDHVSALKRELIKRRMKRLKADREADRREGKKPSNVKQTVPGL